MVKVGENLNKNIKGITIEIGGDTQKLNKALDGVNKQSREIQGELKQVERLLKLDPKNTELLAQKQQLLTDAVSNTSNKLGTLKEAQRQVAEQFARGEIGEEQYRAIQREVIATEQNLQSLQRQLNEVNNGWLNTADNLNKFGTKATEVGKDLTTKVTAPILGIGAAAAKIGMDFEAGMSEVQAISGATGEQLDQLEAAAREMGAKTSKSAKDAADALKYMSLAGWDVQDSIQGLEPILRLSEAGAMDLGRASDLVTDSMSAMGIQVEDLNTYLDKVAKTQSKANTNADAMLEAYVGVGGTLKNLNTDIDTSATLLGVLANRGIKGSEAGTKLNATLVNLSGSTDKTRKIFDELGIAIYDQEGTYVGVEKVLESLKGKFDGMTESERNYYMAQLVGKTQIDTMSALLDGLGNEYYDLKSEIENADGALLTMAKTMQDNNKGSITALLSALEELALKIYDVIAPAIASLIEKIQGVVDWLNNLSPEMQTTIVIVAGLAAAIGPLLILIGQMSIGVGAIIGVIGKLIPIITGATTATGGLATAIGILTGPIGIAIAAIVAIGAVIVALWKTNEEFRDNVMAIWEQIKEIFIISIEIIKEKLLGFYENIKVWWTEHSESILTIINALWNTIAGVINATLEIIGGLLDVFIGLFTGDWERFGEGIKTIWSGMWNGIKSVVEGAWELLSAAFSLLKDNISNWFTDLIADAINWGKELVNGLIDGIKSVAGNIKSAVSSVVSGVSGSGGSKGGGGVAHLPENHQDKPGSDAYKAANPNMPSWLGGGGGVTQNITINSPTALSPSETARQVKKASQGLALQF